MVAANQKDSSDGGLALVEARSFDPEGDRGEKESLAKFAIDKIDIAKPLQLIYIHP